MEIKGKILAQFITGTVSGAILGMIGAVVGTAFTSDYQNGLGFGGLIGLLVGATIAILLTKQIKLHKHTIKKIIIISIAALIIIPIILAFYFIGSKIAILYIIPMVSLAFLPTAGLTSLIIIGIMQRKKV